MDSLKPLEKSSVCFDKHNISNDPNTGQLKHQNINNVQRSVTNEQLRMYGNSGHYATIQDSSDENTLCTPKPRYYNATLGKRESSSDLYVSFNTGDRLPTSPNNERTPGYSYATNGEIHFLRDSNNENHQSKGTDDSTDTYLEPNPRRIGKSGNDTNHSDIRISWLSEAHVYHEPDNGLRATLTSTYDVCRVSSNEIVTAPNKKEKKICSTCKIITCVILVILVAAATASIVAVLMICDLKERASIKEIIASTSYVQGDDANVVCKGLIGIDEYEKKLGEIFVRIYWNEEKSKDITSVIDLTHSSHCQVDVLVNASFVITNDMHGAELQCIARGDDGRRDKKSILLNVTKTKVQISSSPSTDDIDEYFNISTELTYIRGWSTLELRKNCSGTEITIVSIQMNNTLSNLNKEEHIDLIDSEINNTTARLTFQVRNVKCSDACCKGGNIEYISTVEIGDSWVMESESIEFKMNPSVSVLTLEDEPYKRQDTTLKCSGNIAEPSNPKLRLPTTIVEDQKSELEDPLKCDAFLGYPRNNRRLKIEYKLKGSDTFKDYLPPQNSENKKCENSSIEERQHNFPVSMNGSTVRCVVADENNNVIKSSAEKELRILKNVCLRNSKGTDFYDPHPYNCSRYIRCVGKRLYDKACAPGSCYVKDLYDECESKHEECASC